MCKVFLHILLNTYYCCYDAGCSSDHRFIEDRYGIWTQSSFTENPVLISVKYSVELWWNPWLQKTSIWEIKGRKIGREVLGGGKYRIIYMCLFQTFSNPGLMLSTGNTIWPLCSIVPKLLAAEMAEMRESGWRHWKLADARFELRADD